jgi:lipocalin
LAWNENKNEIHIQTHTHTHTQTYRNRNTKEIATKERHTKKERLSFPQQTTGNAKSGYKNTQRIKNAYSSFILNTLVHPAMLSGNETALGTHRETKRTHCHLPFCTN